MDNIVWIYEGRPVIKQDFALKGVGTACLEL